MDNQSQTFLFMMLSLLKKNNNESTDYVSLFITLTVILSPILYRVLNYLDIYKNLENYIIIPIMRRLKI